MKLFLSLCILTAFSIGSLDTAAQQRDTIIINGNNLDRTAVKFGNVSYLVYNKKAKEDPATGLHIANMHVAAAIYNEEPAIAVTQKWDARDTVAHTAYTVLRSGDFSTLLHETWWMRAPYTSKFDFVNRKVSFVGSISDSSRIKVTDGFTGSFEKFNLNWHSDLFLFTLLPYKANRSFRINFYDPGFGKPQEVVYDVTGSEILQTYTGKIDCWVMQLTHGANDYQRFWIDKSNHVVVKEEDFFLGKYRFKVRLEQ